METLGVRFSIKFPENSCLEDKLLYLSYGICLNNSYR